MSKKTNRHSYGTYHYYRCTTHNRMDTGKCTAKTIRVDRLEKAVLVYLQTMVNVSVEYEALLEKIRRSGSRKNGSAAMEKTLAQQLSQRDNYQKAVLELYPDWKSGIISQSEYLSLKADLQSRIRTLEASISQLQETLAQYADGMVQDNAFLRSFQRYHNFTELNREMLVELVKEIRVYEGGRLEILLNFQDELKALTDYLEINREALEETCTS